MGEYRGGGGGRGKTESERGGGGDSFLGVDGGDRAEGGG